MIRNHLCERLFFKGKVENLSKFRKELKGIVRAAMKIFKFVKQTIKLLKKLKANAGIWSLE